MAGPANRGAQSVLGVFAWFLATSSSRSISKTSASGFSSPIMAEATRKVCGSLAEAKEKCKFTIGAEVRRKVCGRYAEGMFLNVYSMPKLICTMPVVHPKIINLTNTMLMICRSGYTSPIYNYYAHKYFVWHRRSSFFFLKKISKNLRKLCGSSAEAPRKWK